MVVRTQPSSRLNHSLANFLKIAFFLFAINNAKTDYLYAQKTDSIIKIHLRPDDSAKVNETIQPNQAVEIRGNIFGDININVPDSSKKKVTADTLLCFKNRCYNKAKFEFRGYVFTDFVAIEKDRPNGLIQTNALLSFTRPTLNYKVKNEKTIRRGEGGFRSYLFRNVVLIDFTLSKLGNQIRYLPVRYLPQEGTDTLHLFNRFDLLQYANIISVTKVNLYTLQCLNTVTFYCDFISMFYNTPISDSLGSSKSNVCSIAFGGNLKAIAQYLGGFSAEIGYSVFAPTLSSNIYSDRASIQAKESTGLNLDASRILNKSPHSIQALDLRIGYASKSKEIDAFFKFSIYQNIFHHSGADRNVFVQIQLGTIINIQKIFGGKE